ncbi:hypothetical protein [Luteimonas sp. YGD11-2]|uniref:hypothetical protein n=1 Tax=Luteimonas sp. YGD11-2 TaxID=2508168 RepID=UPI00100BBA15|nr:hypothetical protein [Luteimonas sp. YGD11-2]
MTVSRGRDWGLIFLWLTTFWGAGKALETLVRFSTTSDFAILSSHGWGGLFFVLSGTQLLLWATLLYYLARPAPAGVAIGLAAIGFTALSGAAMSALVVADLPAARIAYTVSREARGLRVREETLDAVFSVAGIWGSYGVSLLLLALMASVLWRRRRWFGADIATVDA